MNSDTTLTLFLRVNALTSQINGVSFFTSFFQVKTLKKSLTLKSVESL